MRRETPAVAARVAVRQTIIGFVLVMALAPMALSSPAHAATQSVCGPSAGSTLCVTAPAGTASGEVTISATYSGATAARIEFTWLGRYLNHEYVSPYRFIWPTHKYLDASGVLAARAIRGGVTGPYVQVPLRLANGNTTSVPRNPADWQQLFQPQSWTGAPTIAAVGNGGAKKPAELGLLGSIRNSRPAVFLYLGEVHEFGSWATRRDHYGLASFDDRNGSGTLWGSMARYTAYTQGNHESGEYTEVLRDYWHQRPLWTTFRVGGVRVLQLNSECGRNGGCGPGSPQYVWLDQQLRANTDRCVIAFWHRAAVSNDADRSGPAMNDLWALLARNGGDLALVAHTRDMSETRPLNAALQAGRPDSHMVELVSGAAGARWVANLRPDARVAWRQYQVPGAVYVTPDTAGAPRLLWRFRDSGGNTLRSGSVTC